MRQGGEVSPRAARSVSLNIHAAPPTALRPARFSTSARRSVEKGEAPQRSPGGEKATPGVARAVAVLDAFHPEEMESVGEATEKANRLLQQVGQPLHAQCRTFPEPSWNLPPSFFCLPACQVVPLLPASSAEGVAEMRAPLFEFLDRLQGVPGLEGLAVARIRLAYLHLLFKQAPELKPDQVRNAKRSQCGGETWG